MVKMHIRTLLATSIGRRHFNALSWLIGHELGTLVITTKGFYQYQSGTIVMLARKKDHLKKTYWYVSMYRTYVLSTLSIIGDLSVFFFGFCFEIFFHRPCVIYGKSENRMHQIITIPSAYGFQNFDTMFPSNFERRNFSKILQNNQ